MGRLVAALVGLGAVLLSLYGTLWVLLFALITAQRPDPSVPDGDPCCGHPDTWHEVASGAWQTLTLASIDGSLVAVGVAFICYGRDGRAPRWRHLRWFPIGAVALTATIMAVALATGA
jgi:hypothetical protein